MSAQTGEPYRYKRLKEPREGVLDIRLLTLFRGASNDNIYVAINVHSLNLPGTSQIQEPEIDVKWFALSYTWGDPQDPSKVFVLSGTTSDNAARPIQEESYISITKNLSEALRHVRCDYEERFLWVDAICIDQGDEEEALRERAWQVQSMHRIYAEATGVIIWLGAEAEDSTYALGSLHKLGSSIHTVDWTTFDIYTWEGKPSESMEYWYDQQRSSRDHKAVAKLLERPWFDRVWIRQEAFFAKERTSGIFCGDALISFAVFRRAIHFLISIGMDNPRQNARLSLAFSICLRKYSDEPNLMRRIRAGDCKDPRDKVYGNIGILTLSDEHRQSVPVQVDYSTSNSTEQVYKDFFSQYTKRYGTLRLLEEAGLMQSSELRPTWIPDWRSNIIEHQLDLSMESASSFFLEAECKFPEEGILRVLGRYAAKITKVHVLESARVRQLDPDSWEELDSDSWRELAVLITSNLGSIETRTAVERFTRALCCVLEPLRIKTSDLEGCRKEIMEYAAYLYNEARNASKDGSSVMKPPSEIISGQAAAQLVQAVRSLRMRGTPLLFLADRYVGIGPRNVEIGDQIWAILGSRALIVLRELENGKFEVVGSCFVHGFNWGEAILGPLPNQYTVIPRFEETRHGYIPYYLHTETGSASMWDPRIAWEELEAHPPMDNFVPFNSPPGEPFRVLPNSNYLQRHGIQIQQIDLV